MWRKLVVGIVILAFVGTGMAEKKEVKRVITTAKAEGMWNSAVSHSLPATKAKGDTLYYYNAVDADAIGLTSGGTYEAAIKLTPTELGTYGGYALTEVLFYHHETGSHSGNIKIYAAGTDTTPGDLLTSEPYTANGAGWVVVPLSHPVLIDPTSDLWVSVEITHAQGEYPISVDNGPAVAGKGDWVYSAAAGIPWAELRNLSSSLDFNWDIAAVVSPYGDSLDPLPPTDVIAYSDYTMPTSMAVSWTDPTHYVGGDTLTNFHIEIWLSGGTKDSTLVDTVPAGVQTDTLTGLTDGTLYTIYLRAVDANDSTSPFVSTSWYAGGSPYPAPPSNLVGNVVDESHVELTWINPSTQADGTPLDDLAGINIYVDGTLNSSYPTTAAGLPCTDTINVTPGSHSIYVTAYDNETPVHESDPSNTIQVVTNAHAGGPDGFGYTFMDSDYHGGPSFNWIDITSTGTPLNLGDDDQTHLMDIGFTFPFYDTTYTQIDIESNGTVIFADHYFGLSNEALPTDAYGGPWDLIAFYWSDQNPSAHGQVYFQSFGTYAVIEFYEVPEYGGSTYNTYEVVLHQNGDIDMNYLTITDYSDETIGIQDASAYPNGDWYLQYTYDGNPLVPHDSLTIHFAYPVDVSENPINTPKLALLGTTTNPGRGISTVSFSVPKSMNVDLALYDLSGRKVKEIFSGRANAGLHRVSFNTGSLANGIYFVKMEAGNFRDVAKVLVVK